MTVARKTGLLRFSASRCLALIVKEWHQIGRDPSALVIGVFLPLFVTKTLPLFRPLSLI